MTLRLVLPLLLVGTLGRAQPEPAALAADRAARAIEMYRAGRFAEAEAEFRAAYALEPRPDYLYSIGQAARRRGDCPTAVDAYRAFLATRPSPSDANLANANIARCQPFLAPTLPTRAGSAPETARPDERGRAWHADGVGLLLVGGGVATIAGATVLVLDGRADSRAVNSAATYGEFAANKGGKTKQLMGGFGIGLGAALVGAGVIHHLHWSEPQARVSVGVSAGGAWFAVAGTY